MARWVVLATIILATPVFLPRLWGWEFGWVASGVGGWSMAAESGIMPLSITYHQKKASYGIGDIVSFDYQGNPDPSQNGKSVKRVGAINVDGSFRVAGLNKLCSVPPWNAPSSSIYGKVVFHRSLLPVAYWRWLSMGWSISIDDITKREKFVFSPKVLLNLASNAGRIENWKHLSFAPSSVIEGTEGVFVAKQDGMARMYEGRKIVSILKLTPTDTITSKDDGRFFVNRYEGKMPVRYAWTQSGLADRQLVGNVSLPTVPTDDKITLCGKQGDLILKAKSPFTRVEVTISDSPVRVFVVKGDHVIEVKRRDSGLKLAQIPSSTEVRIIGVRPADWGEILDSGLSGVRVY